MENNYNRYNDTSEKEYNKKGLSYFVLRKNADKTIIPYLKSVEGKNCLEVGVGYGYYKDAYFNGNNVTGYDVNPKMGEHLPIDIIEGKADELAKRVHEKFDYVFSFCMTEYLNFEELKAFISQGIGFA